MKKLTKITLYSVVVLASVGSVPVFADDNVPATADLPITTTTTEPTVPSDPTVPSNSNTVVPTEPTVPSDPTVSSNSNTVVSTEPSTAEPVTQNPSVPTNNPNISAQTALSVGASQVGTTSTVTGQVVQNVTANAPVQTDTGASIVSTKNGQLVLSDGLTVVPEAIGAVTNADKTITVTKADGTKATLPSTGEVSSVLTVLGGLLLSGLGLVGARKRKVYDDLI